MRQTLFALTLIAPLLLEAAPARSEVVVRETETGIYVEIVGTPGDQVAGSASVPAPAAVEQSWNEKLQRQREELRIAKKSARRLMKEQEPEEKDEIE